MKILELLNKGVDKEKPLVNPYIIAEIGVNHEGCMKTAKRLVDEAKEGGADAVKFQSYKAETLASKHSPAYWDTSKESTTSQFELFKKHDSFWKNEMQQLQDYCEQLDIEFMSTPFDIESAHFLNEMMNVFKISSSDITNKPFIEYICRFGKPIILSTGASDLKEVQDAVNWIKPFNVPLALLHCVLNYPTSDKNANLGMIIGLKSHFPDNIIGYSDHTLPKDMKVCEIACLLGAVIIEKHFTHDKQLPGNDHYHAMDVDDLKRFKNIIKGTQELLGDNHIKMPIPTEEISRNNARRSIVMKRSCHIGHKLSSEDITYKRPGSGISPIHWDQVIGKSLSKDLDSDHILQWSDLC